MTTHTIESGVRLSESLIWPLQRQFFAHHGLDAWDVVPSFVTSNAAIATRYARVIEAWQGDIGERVTVVELGAGHGRFGYLCLQQLRVPVRYIMTDFTARNLAAWQSGRFLRPLVEAGRLDFALFDAETDTSIAAQNNPAPLRGPLVVIANYVFDGLAQDAWRIERGRLLEGRTLLTAPHTDTGDPALIEAMELELRYSPAQPDYGDADMNGVLVDYLERMESGSFPYPVGALRCIKGLANLSDGPMLLLAADKGYNHLHQLVGQDTTTIAKHGSFSFMVNFDAIASFITRLGGRAMLLSARGGDLEGGVFALGGGALPRTQRAFADHLDALSPGDLSTLIQKLKKLKKPSLSVVLSILRLSAFDPVVFFELHDKLLASLARAAPVRQREVSDALERVWRNYLPLGMGEDVAFAIGRVLQRMGRERSALERYQDSLELFGPHAATYFNMGLCFFDLGEPSRSEAMLSRSLQEDPEFSRSKRWLKRVRAAVKKPS